MENFGKFKGEPAVPEWIEQTIEQERLIGLHEIGTIDDFWAAYDSVPMLGRDSRKKHADKIIHRLQLDYQNGERSPETASILATLEEKLKTLGRYEFVVSKLDTSTINTIEDFKHIATHLATDNDLPRSNVIHAMLHSRCTINFALREYIMNTEERVDPMETIRSGGSVENYQDLRYRDSEASETETPKELESIGGTVIGEVSADIVNKVAQRLENEEYVREITALEEMNQAASEARGFFETEIGNNLLLPKTPEFRNKIIDILNTIDLAREPELVQRIVDAVSSEVELRRDGESLRNFEFVADDYEKNIAAMYIALSLRKRMIAR